VRDAFITNDDLNIPDYILDTMASDVFEGETLNSTPRFEKFGNGLLSISSVY